MKTLLVFIICVFYIASGFAQSHFVRFQSDSVYCTYSDQNILGLIDWDVFQTIDSTITGEKLETCLRYSQFNGFDMSNVQLNAPIFLRNKTDLALELQSSAPYNFNMNFSAKESKFCDCSFECPQSICSSVKVYLTTLYNGDTIHYTRFIDDPIVQFNSLDFFNCFVTKKGNGPTFLNYIELTISNASFSSNDNLSLSNIYINSNDLSGFENKVVTNDFKTGSAYFITPEYFSPFFFGSTFADHRGVGFPAFDNKYYYDIVPEDSLTKQTINILLTPESGLQFQDYTYLRGALLAGIGNDSARHTLNLINEGSTICLPEFVELASSGDSKFIFRSGYLDFQSYTSCLLFMDDAKFVIDKNVNLDYGKNGKGLLALENNASIHLEPHAVLNFNGEIILKHSSKNEMFIDLKPTTKLVFGKGSKVNSNKEDKNIKLKIFMNGGTLDVSNLDASSLEHLDIIYKDESLKNYKSFLLFPNPSSNFISVSNLAQKDSEFYIFNSNGKFLQKVNIEDASEKSIEVTTWANGVYIVKSSDGFSEYFVKM